MDEVICWLIIRCEDNIYGTADGGSPVGIAGTTKLAAFEGNDGPLVHLSVDIGHDRVLVSLKEIKVWDEETWRAGAHGHRSSSATNNPVGVLAEVG